MQRTQRTVFAFATSAVLALMIGVAPALAQSQAPPPPEQSQRAKDPAPVQGEIVSVDATAKTLTVKLADGTDTTFLYNDATQVTGAKDGAAGLATMKEGRVTVHFKEDAEGKAKLATRIIVQPRQ